MVTPQVQVSVGRPGLHGKCRVVARLGQQVHPHSFDPFDQNERRRFREATISKFNLPDDAHEHLEALILSAAESQPSELFRPVVTMLNTVKPAKVDWLWPNRLAIGKNNLLCGDPGLGKSLLTLDIAARVSRGDGFPDGARCEHGPSGVVILTMEDDAADTIVPRLLAHNADLSRIAHVQGISEVDGDGNVVHGIDLGVDLQTVRAAIEQVENCRLVIIDTISDYMGSKTDAHKNRDVRSVLNPMAAMANECRIANLCVSHLRKSEGRAIHATMGSVGFVGQCRVAWAITRCPVNPRRRLMTCIKNNLADDTSGLAYAIEPYGADNAPVLAWEAEPVRMSADEAMDRLRQRPGRKPDDRNSAADWLREQLAAGPRPAADILDDAEVEDFKPWTVRRAFKQLGCQRHKSGFDDGWVWSLPEGNTEATNPIICHLRNLRENPEDNTQKAISNSILPAKVTNCVGSRNGTPF